MVMPYQSCHIDFVYAQELTHNDNTGYYATLTLRYRMNRYPFSGSASSPWTDNNNGNCASPYRSPMLGPYNSPNNSGHQDSSNAAGAYFYCGPRPLGDMFQAGLGSPFSRLVSP